MKNLLRTTALLLIFNCSFIITKAQWVSIPDTAFGSFLKLCYPVCMQGNSTVGWHMDTTCPAVVGCIYMPCFNRPIKNLNGIQYFDSLQVLQCFGDSINTIPRLPNFLSELNCYNNQLTSLPVLPNSLKNLDCRSNYLISLPIIPNSLTYLNCGGNPLGSLLGLPDSLITLACASNQLSSLPALPNSLITLTCNFNQLSSLPTLPSSLTTLYCNNNQLGSLPSLPNSLSLLYCNNNQLVSLPELPDSLEYLSCHNNPNLNCFPRLKKIRSFYFYNTGINCLPNYPQSNLGSNPILSTVPLCDIFNTNSCEVYWNISGKTYVDSNANCLYDAGENTCSNLKVQLYQNGILQQQQNTFSGYSFATDSGTYTYSIDTANLPFILACPASGFYTSVITALDSFDTDMNFGLHCKTGFDLVAQSISAIRFRPANITKVNISADDASSFYNANCASGTSGSVQLIINGAAHYSSAANGALTPTSIVNDTITWSIADFGAVNFFHDFNINVATDTTAVLGSQICFTLIVNPIAGDNNPANNILTHCFTVVGSFDPNEKEV